MKFIVPSKITTTTVTWHSGTGEPFALLHNRVPFALSFPCRFDENNKPVREDIERIIEHAQELMEDGE